MIERAQRACLRPALQRWKRCVAVTRRCRDLRARSEQSRIKAMMRRWQLAAVLRVTKRAALQTALLQHHMTTYAKVLAAWSSHAARCRFTGARLWCHALAAIAVTVHSRPSSQPASREWAACVAACQAYKA